MSPRPPSGPTSDDTVPILLTAHANPHVAYMRRNGASFARPCPVCGAGALHRCGDLLGIEVYPVHAGRGLDFSLEEPSP